MKVIWKYLSVLEGWLQSKLAFCDDPTFGGYDHWHTACGWPHVKLVICCAKRQSGLFRIPLESYKTKISEIDVKTNCFPRDLK